MKKYNNELLSVPGITLNGIYTGVKKSRNDLGIIYTNKGIAAGVFTQNVVKAAPVVVSEMNIKNETTSAIIINSGNANACTGKLGYENAIETINHVADKLKIDPMEVLVSSTGLIGKQLEMDKIKKGIAPLIDGINENTYHQFPESITTTDTYNKTCSCKVELNGEWITIVGVAKGSGMIHPNMATTLGFIQTDVNISKPVLQSILSNVIVDTFNMISVDGDTSTNDMVIALSSCEAKNNLVKENTPEYAKLTEALLYVTKMLAISVAQDGEGATKLIECTVFNANSNESARKMAKSVIQSSLVKAAVFGKDANWGRIICSLGYSGVSFDPDVIDLNIKSNTGKICLMKNGTGLAFDETEALKILSDEKVIIEVDVKDGQYEATAWGCDLTYDYVTINAEYRT